MKKHVKGMALCFAAAAALFGCGTTYPLFINTTLSEAKTLREYCENHEIRSIEVQKADSLAASAKSKAQQGKENEAYWMADAAATYYRLAVAKHELDGAQREAAELRKELVAAREQLETYKEVLNELENMKAQ